MQFSFVKMIVLYEFVFKAGTLLDGPHRNAKVSFDCLSIVEYRVGKHWNGFVIALQDVLHLGLALSNYKILNRLYFFLI